jgi:AmiR/NasT family two-component response regulator
MRYFLLCSFFLSVSFSQAADQNAVSTQTSKQAHAIIEKKCTSCHTKDKIDLALKSGKDMKAIQRDMEKRGVKLNSNERDVLGIFWKQSNPVKK